MIETVVVVGGGIAASRTCVELRGQGYTGEIVLISDEAQLPYDRPPLSKAALSEPVDTTLPHGLADRTVDVRLSVVAQSVDLAARTVSTSEGVVAYDVLVAATGAAPIRLPGPGDQLTLRTAQDAARLRAELVSGRRIVVVGAGWIGAEIVTAAAARSCAVTCVEAAGTPLGSIFGAAVGAALLPLWAGIDLRLGQGVASVDVGALTLDDGRRIEADAVVCGVGVRASVGWLEGSGLTLDRGVVVDAGLRSSDPRVFAVGDVAARWAPRWGRRLGAGHWDDAAEGPAVVAAAIVAAAGSDGSSGPAPVYDAVPYFWSDQFGHKLQFAGVRTNSDREVWRRTAAGALLGVAWCDRDGRLTAYLALDRPRDLLQARLAIAAGTVPDPGRLADSDTQIRHA